MATQPIPEDHAARFVELGELFAICRSAWPTLSIATQGHPAPGSPAANDQERIADRDPCPERAPFLIQAAVQRYMYAASQQFGGLAALYFDHEVLFSPSMLFRNILEHCARVGWVLGKPEEPVEHRLARAYREDLISAEEAKKNAGRLLGKDTEGFRSMADAFRNSKEEIATVFPDGWTDEDGRRLLAGQALPNPEECVIWLLTALLSRPLSPDLASGCYGYLSNLSHPTLYRIAGLWSVEERDGRAAPVLNVSLEDHDNHAQLAVGAFYEVLAYVITYHGWPGESHRDLTAAIDRLLPGLLKQPDE
jgi:hypothetical protein